MDNYRRDVRTRLAPRPSLDGFVQPMSPRAARQRPIARDSLAFPVARDGSDARRLMMSRMLPQLNLSLDDLPVADRRSRLSAGRLFRKWALRGGLAMLALLIAVGALLFAQGYIKLHKVFRGNGNHAAALQANVNPTLLKGEGDGRVNVLLLGVGGGTHEAPDLTDTMIVMSIDPVNGTETLLSVPRDLWVKMPSSYMGNYQKINVAYEAGKYGFLGHEDESNGNTKAIEAGFKAADQVVSQVLGISIHYNALVNFQAFRQAVNTVGGVTINVPSELYDPTMAWENHWNPVLAKKGIQHMSGNQALMYVRSRETSSDFARGERQRSVILALKDKALTLGVLSNPLKISQLMSAFGNNVVTDIGLSDAVRMYDLTKDIPNNKVTSLDLVTAPNTFLTTGNMNGASIDEPKAGLFDYSAIHLFVRSKLQDGYILKEHANITLLNGTSQEGLATKKAAELKSYGYNVDDVGNAPTKGYDKTIIVDRTGGADKYTQHYLENRFGVKAVSKVPDSQIQPGNAAFIIILGNDETANL